MFCYSIINIRNYLQLKIIKYNKYHFEGNIRVLGEEDDYSIEGHEPFFKVLYKCKSLIFRIRSMVTWTRIPIVFLCTIDR